VSEVIIVGKSSDTFIRYASKVMTDCEVDFVRCDDVYSAVGALAGRAGRRTMVVGRLEVLGREDGRFLEKVSERGLVCCCPANGQAQKAMAAGTGAQIHVIREPQQLAELIVGRAESDSSMRPTNGRGSSAEFMREEFLTTRAEMEALLGTRETEPEL